MLAIYDGMDGLAHGEIREMKWTSVHGWVARGGAELARIAGNCRTEDYALIARQSGGTSD